MKKIITSFLLAVALLIPTLAEAATTTYTYDLKARTNTANDDSLISYFRLPNTSQAKDHYYIQGVMSVEQTNSSLGWGDVIFTMNGQQLGIFTVPMNSSAVTKGMWYQALIMDVGNEYRAILKCSCSTGTNSIRFAEVPKVGSKINFQMHVDAANESYANQFGIAKRIEN